MKYVRSRLLGLLLISVLCTLGLISGLAAEVAFTGSGNTISMLQDPTTGTVKNSLAKIGPTGAVRTSTTDTGVDVYVVVSESSSAANVPAILAITGVWPCTMDVTLGSTRGMFVVNSITIPGYCHPQAAQPTNGFVAGRMLDSSTTINQTALISSFNLPFIPGSAGAASISAGAAGQLGQYASAGTTISPLVITPTTNFALVGNGTSWITSTVAMAGAGACSASTVNTGNVANAAPACNPVTKDRVDNTVAIAGVDLTHDQVNGATAVFNWKGVVTPTALVGDVNDYGGCDGATVCKVSGGAADRTITGIASGTNGRDLKVCNSGTTNKITLAEQNALSSATNRFFFGGPNLTLRPRACTTLWYDAGTVNRWSVQDSALLDPYVQHSCRISWGSMSASAAPIPDDDDVIEACGNNTGLDWKITNVKFYANTGAPTVTPVLSGGAPITTLCTGSAGTWVACALSGTPIVHTFSGANLLTCTTPSCTIGANITTAGGVWSYGWMEFIGVLQ
jgi:hypothetical protein